MEEKILFLIIRKMSNEATLEELQELDHYLLSHPETGTYLDLVEHIWNQHDTTDAEENIAASYQKHISRHNLTFSENIVPARPPVYQLLWRKRYLIAAACLLIFISGVYFYTSDQGRSDKPLHTTEVLTAKKSRKEFVLPDGTRVWLNGSSTIKYDNEMTKAAERTVYLTGEAFFDVFKDKEHPFIIKTEKISIKVLGTEFNVKAYPGDKKTETTLIRGSIELTVNNKPYQKIMLKPNEKIVLLDSIYETGNKKPDNNERTTAEASKMQLMILDIQPITVYDKEYIVETSWVENNLAFENESLENLAPRLEKWFDVKIEINSKLSKSMHFTGVFNKQTLEEALSSLQLANPFKFKINQGHVYIN